MLMWPSIVVALIAAGLGLWAAFTPVRYDLVDHQADDHKRADTRTAWAAVAAAVAVLLQAADRLLS